MQTSAKAENDFRRDPPVVATVAATGVGDARRCADVDGPKGRYVNHDELGAND